MPVYDVPIYESPDGEDCLNKTLRVTKTTTFFGAFWSVYEMFGISQPSTAAGIASRFAYFTLPAAAIGATFAGTSCLVGGIRGKDSPLNHAIGGCAAGAVVGAKYGSIKMGVGFCVGFAGLASFIKLLVQNEEDLGCSKRIPYEMGSFHHYHRHYGPRREVGPPPNY